MSKFREWLNNQKYVVIDGALSTALEKKGICKKCAYFDLCFV